MSKRKNIFEDVVEQLRKHGLEWKDVQWVGGAGFKFNKQDFEAYAKKTCYKVLENNNDLMLDLVIAGTTWQLTRGKFCEEDDFDWIFNMINLEPAEERPLVSLIQSAPFGEHGRKLTDEECLDAFVLGDDLNPPM